MLLVALRGRRNGKVRLATPDSRKSSEIRVFDSSRLSRWRKWLKKNNIIGKANNKKKLNKKEH